MLMLALLLAAAAPPQEGGPWRRGPGRGPMAGPERAGPRRGGPGPGPGFGPPGGPRGPGYAPPRGEAPLAPPAIPQQRRGDQWRAFEQRREGRILPLRDIENRVVPGMRGGQYIGFDFDPGAGIYTLKFLRNGTVVWVEVDGRSGQVLGRTRG